MKVTSKILVVLTILLSSLFVSIASFAQVPPPPYKYSCTAQNARGFSWVATGWGIGNAQQNALGECASSTATAYAANCRIIGCTRIGYAPAPAPAPVYGQQFFCTAWGWQHRVSGSAHGYNLNKVAYKAVRNCTYNGGVNCQVYTSPSCPVG